ncbi:uncharacterized protein ACA1_095700 [Acanthamoeba castellanii str. Neff]|uniref:Leucine rich repeat domain containing protein n=1 Tax=Acanthamoeba castellanii (strain ATCC 30010 / Neff) TaxID=1257118 RepID=L8GIK7_ACACF|nr:uncharacterized protein ACA1_095700 [Acanthamoeba castellanii str. Neff]ELR12920.1 hypothetical protein ACA1_095700 [Acanthamoeba castellanii str. Neff]
MATLGATPWSTAKRESDDDGLLLSVEDGLGPSRLQSLVTLCLDYIALHLSPLATSGPDEAERTSAPESDDEEKVERDMRRLAALPGDLKERLWALMMHRGQLSPFALELFVANRGSFRFGDFASFVIGAKPPSAAATGSPDHTQNSQPFITVGELTRIVDSTCPELDTLSLLLFNLIRRRTLRTVSLAECINLTDKSLSLLSLCTHLHTLDLSGNFEMTDKALIGILNKLPSLQHLALRDCAGISPNLTRQLAKNDACVHTLDLSGVKLQSIFSTQKSKEATWQQLQDLRLRRCVLSLPIVKDVSCLSGLRSDIEIELPSLKRLLDANASIQRLDLEGCVIKVAEPKKKAGSKQGKAAAKKKKQDQFERVKQAKNKKNKNNKKGRQPPPAPKTPNKEGAEKSEDDESEPVPPQQQRGGGGGDHMKAGNPLVEFSLRDSRVTPDSRIADVLQTALDRPLPHLAFLDLSMDGTQHLPLRSTWTQHTGLKALSLLGSQWISQHPEPADDPKPPIALSRLRVERPAYLDYNSPTGEWSWREMFGRLAATLTELELVRCVRDPHQLSNLAALFPHAPLHPTHGLVLAPPSRAARPEDCTLSLLPNLRRLRLVDFQLYDTEVEPLFAYLSASTLELLDLSVTTNQVFPKSKSAFVVASRQDWTHKRLIAGRLMRAAYQPSFAYALPFHLPPTMEVVVLGGWLYEHAPGEVNCHQETISDVYRGLQANAERGHAVQVIHHCAPGVTGRRGASLLDDGVLDVTRTCPRFSD